MARPKVYVTRQIPQEGIEVLQASCDVEINPDDRPLTRQELLENVRGRDAVLCLLTDRIDAEVYEAAAGIKGVANYAVGYDNIDVPEATKRGIPVSNTPGVLTDATAEMAWALLFAAGRRMVESDAVMRSGQWKGWGPMQFIGGDVTGATLGIVGAGRIGTAMALKSRGFRMKVLYSDAFCNETLEKELGARKVGLEELLQASDFVSIHVPLMPETRHLFGKKEFQLMKKTAYLINTARGPIVNETELVQALQTGEIAGAGLDVYEKEPLMVEGLAELDNVVLTPHTASATKSSRGGMARIAAENILAMLKGEKAPSCINPDVYTQ
ncbi:D-glycerate dehydrogenase [candidate division KSB3 bacterium]|uniref:D-glycerate dehydrogenase n=1 Tax=candidate division KSB3 bacterium TaxID=2044937 RepID=A0A2G6E9F2_9BACT|nr:MAG: D-glycerate dehydrogenase [candidate division KSB3 bacterium]PIE29535.1 MAG: D-glycerate dehydrogenase [candidate division KSB3 bacterium]